MRSRRTGGHRTQIPRHRPGSRSAGNRCCTSSDVARLRLRPLHLPPRPLLRKPLRYHNWRLVINRAVSIPFILDSGSSEVQLPAEVVLTLIRSGTLTEEDFIGASQYVLANGSTLRSPRFNIREMRVGERVVRDGAKLSIRTPSLDARQQAPRSHPGAVNDRRGEQSKPRRPRGWPRKRRGSSGNSATPMQPEFNFS
jgi:hypothetical protein